MSDAEGKTTPLFAEHQRLGAKIIPFGGWLMPVQYTSISDEHNAVRKNVGVFDMTYKDRDEDTSHHIVYIDPKTKVVLKRESYSQDGKLQAVYFFKKVTEVKPSIWFPTLIEAQNVDRVIAGSTAYKNIKVNTGLSDDIFHL